MEYYAAEIKNKLTVTREEFGGGQLGKEGEGSSMSSIKTHGQSQRVIELRVGGGAGWVAESGCGKMDTTVPE